MNEELPERESVSGMAKRLKMSRQRLYQLLGTAFPSPSQDQDGRPFFDREQQRRILDCYRNNRGVDGRTVFFRPRQERQEQPKARPKANRMAPQPSKKHLDLLQTVRAMGLTEATAANLEEAIRDLFPSGIPEITPEVVKAVYLGLHSRLSGDNPR